MQRGNRTVMVQMLALCMLVGSAVSAAAFPTWMGVYGSYPRHNGYNPGVFTILMNQDYVGLQARIYLRVNKGAWQGYDMTWKAKVGGVDSLWEYTPPTPFAPGSLVDYYFEGCDRWQGCGGVRDDNAGRFYQLKVGLVVLINGQLSPDADLNQPLQVIFTPEEPAFALELEMIEQVMNARRRDRSVYAEGANPYRIRYAVYNLTHPDLAARLADAEDLNVDVQILIESDKLDPAQTWHTIDEYLAGRGFEIVPDHRALTAAQRKTADLIGISDSQGLMHLKTRLYQTPTWAAALSGSHNPESSAMVNDETLHLIREPTIISAYNGNYERVRNNQALANAWKEGAAVNVLFTPVSLASAINPAAKILQWLEEEDEQILLSVFTLRDIKVPGGRSLVQVLANKVRQGVPVHVITDRKQSDNVDRYGNPVPNGWANDNTEDRLRAAGVHVYEVINTAGEYTAMHAKCAILGRSNIRIITDAANWTASALGSDRYPAKNCESILFIDSASLDGNRTGHRYLANWLRILRRYDAQSNASLGEPLDAELLFKSMIGSASWPQQDVYFVARHGYAYFGMGIRVLGNLAALGNWGAVNNGIEMVVQNYPTWVSRNTVSLPVGSTFNWKFVRAWPLGTTYDWEGGDNRWGFTMPEPLVPLDDLEMAGTCRF